MPPSFSQTRRSSESLHAWAQQPFWACGASPSAFSETWQTQPALRFSTAEASSDSADAFEARPVFLQRDDRIKAHFLTCFMALMVYRILEKQLGEKFTVEQLVETLKGMNMQRPGEKLGYIPAYTRTEITDALHENAGFRTDYEILTDLSMKKVIRSTKK